MYDVPDDLTGPLAPYIPTQPVPGIEAIFLASRGVAELTAIEREHLLEAFHSGFPIACVDLEAGALRRVVELLSPDDAVAFEAADEDDVEVHVLQARARGLRHVRYYAPTGGGLVHSLRERVGRDGHEGEPEPSHVDEEPDSNTLGVAEVHNVVVDDDAEARTSRVHAILEDLRGAHPHGEGENAPDQQVEHAMSMAPDAQFVTPASGAGVIVDLWKQARHIKSEFKWPYVVRDGGKNKTFYLQIVTVAIAARVSRPEPKDFFYIVQYGLFNPSNCFVHNEDKDRGWYVKEYTINSKPVHGSAFTLIKTSPDTTVDSTSVTSGISFSLSGNVGFFGDAPMGGVNVGATISNSTTTVIRDVSVLNQSADQQINAKWKFEMPKLEAHGVLKNELTDPVKLATNTFQPVMYMLWDCSTTNRASASVPFHVELSAQIRRTSLSWHFFYYTIHNKWFTPTRSFKFNVAVPPAPKAGF